MRYLGVSLAELRAMSTREIRRWVFATGEIVRKENPKETDRDAD